MKRKSDSSIKTLSPKDGSKNSKGIRTRLSTGTLIMSGTSTVSLADAHFQESTSSANSSSMESDGMTVSKQKEATSPSTLKRKQAENKDSEFSTEPPKRRKIGHNDGTGEDNRNDYFCWICHKDGTVICCELCPRVFHAKCLSIENNVPQDWICPECENIMQAECTDTRSKTMSLISVSTLCTLLRYALDRMRSVGSDTFEDPVDPALFPNYSDYIFYPMSLSVLEKNIKKKNYGCTEAFLADTKWIHHNSVVYNGAQNKITAVARAVLKVCKHEMSEIEVCPDCYYNSCVQSDSDWFCEPCRNPHPLVWAKLKGYPFWPAKALRESNDQVDVRFFGAHDRSWVPVSSCFMLSKACPVMVKKGRGGMAEAMREVEVHIRKLRDKLGTFEYAPFQTPYKSDAVYSKLKSSKSDGNKHAGHGKMGKSKAAEGRLGEKQSVVSKTAMALKSKYNSMSSKKGGQQLGTALKPGATQSQQVIYLKPMPKGVFLLSEQAIEDVDVKKTHGTILRRNIPDLQLIKRISDKIQPEVVPSSSLAAARDTEDRDVDVTDDMEIDAADRGATEKREITPSETVEGSKSTPVTTSDVPVSVTDIQSSVTTLPLSVANLLVSTSDIQSSVTTLSLSVTNLPPSVTDKPLPATDRPLLATNVPLSATDVPLSTSDTLLSAMDVSLSTSDTLLSATEIPKPTLNSTVQNNLLSENSPKNANIPVKQLENSESKIVSFQRDRVLDEEMGKHGKDSQGLEKEDNGVHKIYSSYAKGVRSQGGAEGVRPSGGAEGVRPPGGAEGVRPTGGAEGVRPTGGAEGVRPTGGAEGVRPPGGAEGVRPPGGAEGVRPPGGAEAVRPPGGAEGVIPTGGAEGVRPTGGAEGVRPPGGAEGVRPPGGAEGVRPPGGAEAVRPTGGGEGGRPQVAVSLDAGTVEVSSKSITVLDDCTADTHVQEDSNSSSAEFPCPVTVSRKIGGKETSDHQILTSDHNEISTQNILEGTGSASLTDKIVFTVHKVTTHDQNEKAELSNSELTVRIVSPIKGDNLEKSSHLLLDTVRGTGTSVCVSEAAEEDKQCQLTQLGESEGEDLVVSKNVSAASPSPCVSTLSVVSSSNVSSASASTLTASPGSMYKESLQKVIDSCKAKLGIDDENLNNVENDVVVLEGDEEEDSIIISDNEFDNDSDVLLMDIDEHSQDQVPSVGANTVAEEQSADVSASLKDAVTLNPATGNVEQVDINLHSDICAKDTVTSIDKSILFTLVLNNNNTNTAELEENTDSDKVVNSTDKSTSFSSNIAASSLKEKDGSSYTTNEVPIATSFDICAISRNQGKTSTSDDVSTETSTNISTDSNPDVSQTISVQSTPVAVTISAVSNEKTSDVRKTDEKTVSNRAVVTHSGKAPEPVDEASLTSNDDDEYDVYVDDNVTLDMEVVCSDGPEESSDEGNLSEDEVIRVATTGSTNENIGNKTSVSSRDSTHTNMVPPGSMIMIDNQNSGDSSSLSSYTALRGALAAPLSPLDAPKHSKISRLPLSSTASTSGDRVRVSLNNTLTSTVSKMSGNTEVSVPVQQKMYHMLSSKLKRKSQATPRFVVVSLDAPAGVDNDDFDTGGDIVDTTSRSSRDKHTENPAANTIVALNGDRQHAESRVIPAAREGSAEHLEGLNAALSTSIESLVKNRCSLFEKFVMEQLNEMAVDVKKATELSIPQQIDTTQQTAIQKLQIESTKKQDDLKKAMNEALRESLENFKLQKSVLADKLKEEFSKELHIAVADTKKQQWCAECWKEAVYYCCWNTSYCSYQCQQKHWPSHMPKCMQTQTQAASSSSLTTSQSPTIISTLNATVATNRSTPSLPSRIIVVTTTPSTHPTTAITSVTASKLPYRVPTMSIVSPSQWKPTEESSKPKKMYSLVPQQPTSASISTLSIGPPHFQIQYLQQQATGALPQQVQVVGANPSPVPLLMPSIITSQNQNPVASPVHLLQNTSMLPLMQRPPQAGIQQQAQSLGATRLIFPNTFGTFLRPGGPV